MAFLNDQNEPMPSNDNKKESLNHLPKYFRTNFNKKFLNATVDQLIQSGVVQDVNGFFGRKNSVAFDYSKDLYISDKFKQRNDYQFEPAVLVKDDLGNLEYYNNYNDFVNLLQNYAHDNINHDVANSAEYYAWQPHIDFDKFTNFSNYYWLPYGPSTVQVYGQTKEVKSTYSIDLRDNVDNFTYVFTPDGLTNNPDITLYRGQSYKFVVNVPNYPIAFVTKISFTPGREYGQEASNTSLIFENGITKVDDEGFVTNEKFIENGTIEFTVPDNAPDVIYYISKTDPNLFGSIRIYDILENSEINVEKEIIGKKDYITSQGWALSNGMKISFLGNVFPEKYSNGEWFVEGVGDSIELINSSNIESVAGFLQDKFVNFDEKGFDSLPFSKALKYLGDKDYITINRSSLDGNAWSSSNRWFHIDVIEKSFVINQEENSIDQSLKASRPIIEFNKNLKLFQYGTKNKGYIDLVDDVTVDAFSNIEGSEGYFIDGVELLEGLRVVFLKDTDILVKDRIFKVKFITVNNKRQITLIEDDTVPELNETIHVRFGESYVGKSLYFNGTEWKLAQQKTSINQPPLFDCFDKNDISLSDKINYPSSNFVGNKIFSYEVGNGNNDAELGFPITYRNIQNSGDIVFKFDLVANNSIVYKDISQLTTYNYPLYIRKYNNDQTYKLINGFIKVESSRQNVLRQFIVEDESKIYPIDMYDDNNFINDLWLRVYVDNVLQKNNFEYVLEQDVNGRSYIKFLKNLSLGSSVLLKTRTKYPKNDNGFYEIPANLEKNPGNEDLNIFTFGEVLDHCKTIIEEIDNFEGVFPGRNNLRDLGLLFHKGRKFCKHSSLFNFYSFSLLQNDFNILDAISFSQEEYSKFKRNFISNASTLGFDGEIVKHFDMIMASVNENKTEKNAFYLSDMFGINGILVNETIIEDVDQVYFGISEEFKLDYLSDKSVLVYKNKKQLIYGKDYKFLNDGFVEIYAKKEVGDEIRIFEFESTNGSFVPPTPTKLGLYPKFEPRLYIDDTVQITGNNISEKFKLYGVEENTQDIGWFFPLYQEYEAASNKDVELGGSGEVYILKLEGLSKVYYLPMSDKNLAAQDNEVYDELIIGEVVIQGHDNSKITAFKDYRDNLILELEKRIFNNIKINYDADLFDIYKIIPGYNRQTNVSRSKIENLLFSDFAKWIKLVNVDFVTHQYFNFNNKFTYNFNHTKFDNGESVPGWWRGIFHYVYDTDRPHTHPWEMLGFSIKPDWWEEQYGKLPYTRNNLQLWQDLEAGIIRKPTIKIDKRFVRQNLTKYIPVDEHGNLVNPLYSNILKNYAYDRIQDQFSFGDYGPVETAWRRSSGYVFSLLKAAIINKPSYVFSAAFDRNRQKRNVAGQIVYSETDNHIKLSDLIYMEKTDSEIVNYCSGLINYVFDYQNKIFKGKYEDYKRLLKNITNQMSIHVGGFTDKDKFKLILDSRSPSNNGNVFVPSENYTIHYVESYPIEEIVYSGVLIEKQAEAFYIRGYDNKKPIFPYYKVIKKNIDRTINIGGISENFINWTSQQAYVVGTIIRVNEVFYRVKVNHTSTDVFDSSKFTKLPSLPIDGGIDVGISTNFEKTLSYYNYDTGLKSTQEVVDFLLGYGHYLESIGFTFEKFINEEYELADWNYAIKQFVFWCTQNWQEGSIITLSPGAYRLNYHNPNAVAGNTLNSNYNVLDADGTSINFNDLNFIRDNNNNFIIDSSSSDNSIYYAKFPLVLKEHVVIIDNITVFNDFIYDIVPGYRQDRIKVTGYITNNWSGSFNIEGFIYNDATIKQWVQWNDYNTGDLVKYKEFYYIAPNKIAGKEFFEFNQWTRLESKPESKLMANFDYKVEQFNDFYSLDSNNLNVELQQIGQHLIGYQKRQYLENIINNEVSQYKFYQGFIRAKGTKKSLSNLFDVLSSNDKESLEFFEEWAVRVGAYGGTDTYKEFDYIISKEDYSLNPQPILLTNQKAQILDNIYRIKSSETYVKYENYNHTPFPVVEKGFKNVFSDIGYVNVKDVDNKIENYTDLLNYDANDINQFDYIHVVNYNLQKDWAVLKYIQMPYNVTNISIDQGVPESFFITLDKLPANDIFVGSIVGIVNIVYSYFVEQNNNLSKFTSTININQFFKVIAISSNILQLESSRTVVTNLANQLPQVIDTEIKYFGILSGFENSRVSNYDDIKNLNFNNFKIGHKIWIDNNNDWNVIHLNDKFERNKDIAIDNVDDIIFDINEKNTVFVVGYPNLGDGKVYIYERAATRYPFVLKQILEPNETPILDFLVSNLGGINEYTLNGTHFSVEHLTNIFVNGEKITNYTISLQDNKVLFSQTYPFGAKIILDFSQHVIPFKFGKSVKISKDSKFVAIGSPDESFIKTKFVGNYAETESYEIGDIVLHNDLYWTALFPILPAADFSTINSFYNFNEFLSAKNLDTENAIDIAIMLTGNYPISGSETSTITDHFLIKLDKEIYNGVQAGDEIVFQWNKFTNANQTQLEIVGRQPFNNTINFVNPNLQASDVLTGKHTIQEKVECIIVVENTVSVELNSRVYSGNAYGDVAYQYSTVFSTILYLKNVYKVFDESSILYQDGEILGDYTLALTNEDSLYGDVLGKYVKIDVPTYYVGDTVIDSGRGLVVKEIITDSSATNLYYFNILDNVEINRNASLIKRFSYNGLTIQPNPQVLGEFEAVDQEYLLRYYAVRIPVGENFTVGDNFSFYYNQLPKTVSILKVKNVRFNTAPSVVVGEILTQRNSGAFATVYSNVVILDPDNIDTTQLVYLIQVQFLSQEVNGTIFNFEDLIVGSVSGETFVVPTTEPVTNIYKSITDIGFTSKDVLNDSDNLLSIWNIWDGYIIYKENNFSANGLPYEPYPKYFINLGNLATEPGRVGQIIREKGTNNTAEVMHIQRIANDTILAYVSNVNGEWKLGEQTVINGVSQDARLEMLAKPGINDPYNRPNVYDVDRDIGYSFSTSLETTELGKLLIVEHDSNISITDVAEIVGEEYWIYKNEIVTGQPRLPIIPSRVSLDWQEIQNLQYDINGNPSTFEKEGSLYIYELIGKIYRNTQQLVLFDRDDNTQFGEDINLTSFNQLYKVFSTSNLGTNKNINIYKKGIENSILYDWATSKNPKYRGTYNDNETYFAGDIVLVDNVFYVSNSNRSPESFAYAYGLGVWQESDNLIDYTGYLPNNHILNISFDSVDISTIPLENLFEYGKNYTVSSNGEVVVVVVKYDNEVSNTIAVYRNLNGYYKWSQNISAPDNSVDFGYSVSLNADGSRLIVSDPKNNFKEFSNGVVFYYSLENNRFILTQNINNIYNEAFEKFGEHVRIDENLLYVYSKNGFQTYYTILDNNTTTFDNNFTRYNTIKDNLGSVSIFEMLEKTFVYASNLDMQITDESKAFGEIITTQGNHVYICSRYKNKIIEYSKKKKELFTILRKPKYPVDVTKIKKINLYDKRTKNIIKELDYIDFAQGKIPGPAEQNIDFKIPYDPAIYTNTDSIEFNQHNTMYWSDDHLHEIWWNTKNVKFFNPYQDDIIYSTNYWFKLSKSTDIEIYEWTESQYTPTQWNELSGTSEGISLNITGTANSNYSVERKYNEITNTFYTRYYFWVKNVTVLPFKKGRSLTGVQIKNLIQDPLNDNYSFVSLISSNEFALFNCKNYLQDDNVVISFQIYTDTITPEHLEYKLLTVDNAESKIPDSIYLNLVDCLVGYDLYGRSVPDNTISEKYRYGNLVSPRQSWFKDRHTALKIYFDRVNSVLKNYLLVDNKDISALFERDESPSYELNFYDLEVDTYDDLFNYGIGKTEQAEISLIIDKGVILDVFVVNPGYGYLVTPTYTVIGKGTNLQLDFELDTTGGIASVSIINGGENYDSNTYVVIRKFTVLVSADETVIGKWALYEKNTNTNWNRIQTQGFDTKLYWKYIDWYENGYNSKSKINHTIDYSYQLEGLSNSSIGDVVKIKNIKNNEWLLLKKINNIANADYTTNYETIGKQNGTIEFSSVLYNAADASINFDLRSYDTNLYDSIPSIEIRNILNAIRNDIFINDLAIEYNKLFFSMLRYAFYEHPMIDWAFKTNFIKVKHNVGKLRNDFTFNNDNLSSYEDYVKEVKPFKSKLREFVSVYDTIENSSAFIGDFDLSPQYQKAYNKILPYKIIVTEDGFYNTESLNTNVAKIWNDFNKFSITDIKIGDGGSGYSVPPKITITGGGGSGFEGIARLGNNGSITAIDIINSGSGYFSTPKIIINGSVIEGGKEAKLSAILGNQLPRSLSTAIKFDRLSKKYEISNLDTTETFIGTNNKFAFVLKWPLQLTKNKVSVSFNNNKILSADYTITNVLDNSKGYDRYVGVVNFDTPPNLNTEIVINYLKDVKLLNAQDRFALVYSAMSSNLTLSNYMDGIDYGGVQVKSILFGTKLGWDATEFLDTAFDINDDKYNDIVYKVDKNLIFIEVLNRKYSIDFNIFAKLVVAIVNGDSNFLADKINFYNLFNVDYFNQSINNPIDGTSILNVANDVNLSISSANIFQDYSLGLPVDDFNNIAQEILPKFSTFTETEILLLIDEKVLNDVVVYFGQPLEVSSTYNVYYNNVRIDDPDFVGDSTLVNNPNAIMQTIIGDGVREDFIVQDYIPNINANDLVIIRKSISDGSFIPNYDNLDTEIQGGLLNYSNAKGIVSNEIVIDGDNFVTPTNSKGPEELVPGLVQDSFAITVYERPNLGGSFIYNFNYIGNGEQKEYDITMKPVSELSLIVKINNVLYQLNEDYMLNYLEEKIIFVNTPALNDKINITILDYSADDVLDTGVIVADGMSNEFLLNVRWQENLNSQITVNGKDLNHILVASDTEYYDSSNNVLIKFADIIEEKSIINYLITFGKEKKHSSIHIDEFIADGSTNAFKLYNAPFAQQPAEWHTLVFVNNQLLNPGYVETFTLTNATEYSLKLYQVPLGSLSFHQIKVFLNGVELQHIIDWNYTSSTAQDLLLDDYQQLGSIIEITEGLGQPGDILKVYVYGYEDSVDSGGDYRFGYFDNTEFTSTPDTLYINPIHLNVNDIIRVYQFSNHDSQSLDWQSFDVVKRTEFANAPASKFDIKRVLDDLTQIKFSIILEANKQYQIYKNGLKIDDLNFGEGNVSNNFAIIKTPFGTGSNILNFTDIGLPVAKGDVIKIIEIQSDYPFTNTDEYKDDFYEYQSLRNGIIPLNSEAIDAQYVWVVKNRTMLTPSVDYRLSVDRFSVKLAAPLDENDNIQVIHFSNKLFSNKFAWQQFHDILNNTHYMSLNGENNITLVQDLYWYDKFIEINDGSLLPQPNQNSKYPGVVTINGERIEYYEKTGNILFNLRRGTLGTGVKNMHAAGTEIYNQSIETMLPYKDEIKSTVFNSNGENTRFVLDFIPNSIHEFEVFVGGKRLRKNSIASYNPALGQDSPEADLILPPEFTLENNNELVLLESPLTNEKITVIRRQGKIWKESGKTLNETNNPIVQKIRINKPDMPR